METPMIELNETNYCDQKPITMSFSFEEHDLLNSMLNHFLDIYDFVGYGEIYDLPENSELKKRYNMILEMKERSHVLWAHRFDHPPYDNGNQISSKN
jgi:hypothetical protein